MKITAEYITNENEKLQVKGSASTNGTSYTADYRSGKIQALKGITTGAVRFSDVRLPHDEKTKKLPFGAWPALWLLPLYVYNGAIHPASMTLPGTQDLGMPCWPEIKSPPSPSWCTGGGEIDVLEIGYKTLPETLMQTTHIGGCWSDDPAIATEMCKGTPHDSYSIHQIPSEDTTSFTNSPRSYAVAWDATQVVYYIDDNVMGVIPHKGSDYYVTNPQGAPFGDGRHYYSPIINLAVGGGSFAPKMCTESVMKRPDKDYKNCPVDVILTEGTFGTVVWQWFLKQERCNVC